MSLGILLVLITAAAALGILICNIAALWAGEDAFVHKFLRQLASWLIIAYIVGVLAALVEFLRRAVLGNV